MDLKIIATDFKIFKLIGSIINPFDIPLLKKIKTDFPYLIISSGQQLTNFDFPFSTFNIFLTINQKGWQFKINDYYQVTKISLNRDYDLYSDSSLYVIDYQKLLKSPSLNLKDLLNNHELKGFPYYFSTKKNAALFLDRDGILVKDLGYPNDYTKIELIPEILPIIEKSRSKNMLIIIVSNQSGIARGKIKLKELDQINKKINQLVKVDAIYNCPYFNQGKVKFFNHDSIYRKPNAGMILKAALSFDIDLTKSIMIGDKDNDIINIMHLKSYLVKGNYPLKKDYLLNFKELLEKVFI